MVLHYRNTEPLGIVESEGFDASILGSVLNFIHEIFKGKWRLLYLIKAYFIRLNFVYDTLNKMEPFFFKGIKIFNSVIACMCAETVKLL